MTHRYGPNTHDDPRLETGDNADNAPYVPTELDRRRARTGADMVRISRGIEPRHAPEDKIEFDTDRARQIAEAINNSDTDDPTLKTAAARLIDVALDHDQITPKDAINLRNYLNALEVSADRTRYEMADHTTRQAGDY